MANEAPSQQVDINRRTFFVGILKEDRSIQGCVYFGQSSVHDAADDDERWQIWRITNESGAVTTRYANYGKYNARWTDRASYFPACGAALDPLPGDTNTNVVSGPPTVRWIEMLATNTEQSYALPANTKRFEIINRSSLATIRFAYETGKAAEMVPETDNEYWPLDPLTTYGEQELAGDLTLYFETPSIAGPGPFIVIKSWQQ